MKEKKRILYLLDRYINEQYSDEERDELFEYMNSGQHDHIISDHILKSLNKDSVPGNNLDEVRSEEIMEQILLNAGKQKTLLHRIAAKPSIRHMIIATAIAASIIIAFLLLSPHFITGNKKLQEVASLQKNSKQAVNDTKYEMSIQLQDGSRVILQPGAMLTYPNRFVGTKREVQLYGDAFFDIAKNPGKPFLVYHGNLVTKVLGTSFNIKDKKNSQDAEVEVVTGKVEVYENPDIIDRKKTRNNGVIITPNQKVIYVEEKNLFSTTLVDNPVPVITEVEGKDLTPAEIRMRNFHFDKATIAEIIQLLHNAYGIEIEMENEGIANCQFSGDISEFDLFSKLDMLCQAVGIDYSVKGTRILLRGNGCKH